jgi:hypothetical protein
MATDKTRTISVRVPVEVGNALVDDAGELGISPGSLVRKILEGRYSAASSARKTRRLVEKTRDKDLVELPS